MGLKEKLLQAFAAEHQELLQRIRAALDRQLSGESSSAPPEWAEAYRAAHSLKGAARVCDLPGIQQVGTVLQTIFGRVRDGALTLSAEHVRVIREAADGVERAAQAGVAGQPVPDLSAPAAALEKILAAAGTDSPNAKSEPSKRPEPKSPRAMGERLLAAFQAEHQEHLESIRAILGRLEGQANPVLEPAQINEVFRGMHSIKGAARVNELHAVQSLAHILETLFAKVRDGALALTPGTLHEIHRGLDALEDAAAAGIQRQPAPDISAALKAIESLVSGDATTAPAVPVPASAPKPEPAEVVGEAGQTVRINATALDRILDTAGQLMTECFQQAGLRRDLSQVARATGELRKEWETATTSDLQPHGAKAGPDAHRLRELTRQMASVRRRQSTGSWTLERLGRELHQNVRQARFVPAATVFQGFRKMVRDLAGDEGKEVEAQVTGLEVEADRLVLQALKDPVMHLLRNAVSHGVEKPESRRTHHKPASGRVALRVASDGNRLLITVEDDGAGIDLGRVTELAIKRGIITETEAAASSAHELTRLILRADFSTSRVITEVSGRGIGLSVVNTTVMRLGGELEIEPQAGGGTCFRVTVPLSLATQRLVMAQCRGREFGLPFTAVESILRVKWADVRSIEGHPHLLLKDEAVPLTSLEQVLHFDDAQIRLENGRAQIVVLRGGGKRLALTVDGFAGTRDTIVKDLPPPVAVNPQLSGAIITEQGGVALVLNPVQLIQAFAPSGAIVARTEQARTEEAARHTVLVVDDSFTTRTLEKSLLEAHGYQVLIAVDGVEGLARLRAEKVDLAIIDVEMPRMDGFTMLEEIKKDNVLKSVPVIMVTSLEKRTDIERGLNLGAEAYIVKRKFDHQELLRTIEQIL